MSDRPRRLGWRRPRVRISVRALMGLVLALGVGLGWYVRRVHVQQDAVAAIQRAGGVVAYDWEWGNYNPDIISYTGKPRAPKWLANIIPVDYVASVVRVSLLAHDGMRTRQADDETLAHIGRLGRLESLWVDSTAVTDAGLAHLEGLTALWDLRLDRTRVSDAGLVHLRGMTRLARLFLLGSRVTDAGVLELERALPRILIHRWEELATSANIPRAVKDLDFARSQPVRLAAALLLERARRMTGRRDVAELIATVDALCALEANDPLSLLTLAQARDECTGILQPAYSPDLADSQRQSLRRRCADRGIGALTRAIELGYDNVRRLEGGDPSDVGILFGNLRDRPEFPRLIAEMKAKHPGR